MSFIDPEEYLRIYEPKFASPKKVSEDEKIVRDYYRELSEERRKQAEWRKKHPILAALFG